MSRTILNIDGTNRTINPRNGTSVFVDLSSNQSIGGVKTFLNNTNFNTIVVSGDINSFSNILSSGTISGASLSAGSGSISGGTITGTSLSAGSGSVSGGTISASVLLRSNIISTLTGTVMTINPTSEFNFSKTLLGVNRIKLFPTSTAGDVIQICKNGTNDYSAGYLYINNTGQTGYNVGGDNKWQFTETGLLTIKDHLVVTNNATIFSDYLMGNTVSTYRSQIWMNQLFTNPTVNTIELKSQYIAFTHPFNTISATSKYLFIQPAVGTTGDFAIYINNIPEAIIATDIPNRRIVSDYIWEWRKPSFVASSVYLRFLNGSAIIGSVTMLTASTIAYNVSSDYRLKQDIIPLNNVLEKIKMLNPVTYRFKHDVEEGYKNFIFQGFIAHEVSPIVPLAVSGEKDDPKQMQQMDYAKLTPILTAGVKDLIKEVEELKIYNKSLLDIIDKLIKRVEKLEYNLM